MSKTGFAVYHMGRNMKRLAAVVGLALALGMTGFGASYAAGAANVNNTVSTVNEVSTMNTVNAAKAGNAGNVVNEQGLTVMTPEDTAFNDTLSASASSQPGDGGFFAPLPKTMPAPRFADHGADNFFKSDKVTMTPVSFKNQFDMTIAGNLCIPKNYRAGQKLPAIIIGAPMGAVKEQAATLYAQKLAEDGFVTLAIDTPYWGSSSGTPRNSVLPDMYSEAWMAAVDYLGTRDFVDRDNIGGIGICGSGSFLISAAKIDPRIKAVATVSMYNMGAASRNGLRHQQTLAQREAYIAEAAQQRYAEYKGAPRKLAGGTTHTLNADTNPIQQEFYDYYRTTRGAAAGQGQDMNTTTHPTLTSNVKFMNFYPFQDIDTISPRPMLFITGDQAHSKEFSEDAYRRAKEPKELYYVKGAGHVDLYDKTNLIPFDKLDAFFTQYLHKDNKNAE